MNAVVLANVQLRSGSMRCLLLAYSFFAECCCTVAIKIYVLMVVGIS
jgi:hypothetical protein